METGQLYMMLEQRKNNLFETYFKELSIQIKLSGLSFCVFNPILNCIETIHAISWDDESHQKNILDSIRQYLSTESALRQDFSMIRAMHSSPYITSIPKDLFNSDIVNQYLKYNVKIFPEDVVAYDEIEALDLVLAYIPYESINQMLINHFGKFDYEHSASVLLRSLLSHKATHGKNVAYAYIEEEVFYLVVFKDHKLIFFNNFVYHTIEDFLYYLLFSFEQLNISTDEIPLYLMGNIDHRMPLYAAIYKYVRNVYFFISVSQKNFCQDMDDGLVRKNYLLTHLF